MNRIVRPLSLLPLLASALAWSAPPPAEHPSDQPRGQFLGAQSTHYPDWFLSSFLELAEDVDQAAAAGKATNDFQVPADAAGGAWTLRATTTGGEQLDRGERA